MLRVSGRKGILRGSEVVVHKEIDNVGWFTHPKSGFLLAQVNSGCLFNV